MSTDKNKLKNIDVEDMEDVELHRANSMPGSNIDFIKNEDGTYEKAPENAIDYIAFQSNSFCSSIGYMKIEVVLFLYMFSYIMRSVSSTSMIMDKACAVHFGQSESICKNLADHPDIKSAVEKLANNYSLGHSLITLVPSSILACFIGSWSDKYGRKLPLMMALLGVILDGLGSTICAAFFYSRIEYYFIPAIFSAFSGGFIGVMTVVFSYAADTTTFNKRTLKYAILEMSFLLAMPLGTLTGGWLFKFYGYTYVFLLSTAGHVLALAWVMFVIVESRGLDNKDSWKVKLRSLFSTEQVLDSFRATIKKRPNKGREQILWLLVAMSCAVLSYVSTSGINFFYVHHCYNWDNTQYSTVSAIFSILGIIAMLICVPLFKKFNLGDATLGLVGSVSLFMKNIGIGLATDKAIYFFANLAGLLMSLGTLAGRSRISKVASKNDIGKIFAFLTTAESLLPILSTAIVSQVFNATLDIFPGLIYLIMGVLILIPIGVFVWLGRLPNVNYEEMYNNTTEEVLEQPNVENNLQKAKY